MNFRIQRRADDVEINFVPLIDVLIVLLIFLMVTTTFGRIGVLGVDLPRAGTPAAADADPIQVTVDAAGAFSVNGTPVPGGKREALIGALRAARGGREDARVVLNADRRTAHEWVVLAMESAREAGLSRLSFAVTAAPAE
jgi:biopolymer transport protein ExbD